VAIKKENQRVVFIANKKTVEILKDRARKENRSLSNYVKTIVLDTIKQENIGAEKSV